MWPFDIRKRRYERHYKAALIVFLAAHMFEQLNSDQRSKVESEMDSNLNRSDTPAVAWRRWADWEAIAAFRAAAMQKIGIEPPIPELSWAHLFRPWAHWRKLPQWPIRNFDTVPAAVVLDFRLAGKATKDAIEFLGKHEIRTVDNYAATQARGVAV